MSTVKQQPSIRYFEKEDVLHLVFSEEEEANSFEISPGITVELNNEGEIIGVEILNATRFLRDWLLESIQAKLVVQSAS